eukprot:PITA_23643
MKLTSWNLRGLNSPRKLRMIKNMIKQEQPQIFFMQEMKCNSNTLGNILSRAWPGCHSVAVDASGASGGLAIAWNTQAITLSEFHASHHIIQATFHIIGTNIHGHLTNVYFPQEAGNKIALLDTIEALNFNRLHPLWIIGGDFNMITKLEQENGHFKDFIQNNMLIDLQFCNGMHTWSNRRVGRPGNSTRRPFRFEAFWVTHHAFNNLIRSTWTNSPSPEGSKMYQFQQKLKFLKSQIKCWNQETFGNIFQAQQDLNKEMRELQQQIITEGYKEGTLKQDKHIHNQLEERIK